MPRDLRDDAFAAEIELLAEAILAAGQFDRRLAQNELDGMLGVRHEPAPSPVRIRLFPRGEAHAATGGLTR